MILYTIIAWASTVEATREAYANWRSGFSDVFTTALTDASGEIVAYISSGFLEDDPTMVADNTEVYPNTQPQEVIDRLGYTLSSGGEDDVDM